MICLSLIYSYKIESSLDKDTVFVVTEKRLNHRPKTTAYFQEEGNHTLDLIYLSNRVYKIVLSIVVKTNIYCFLFES